MHRNHGTRPNTCLHLITSRYHIIVRGTPSIHPVYLVSPRLYLNPFDATLRPPNRPTASWNAAGPSESLPLPPINPGTIMSALFRCWRLSSVYRCTGSREIPHLCSLWISPASETPIRVTSWGCPYRRTKASKSSGLPSPCDGPPQPLQ